jgi:hypothetical protein
MVRVTGTDAQPYVGGSVTWEVGAGAAVDQANTVTDANGHAVARVSLLAPGPVTIIAQIAGGPGVTFTANAIPACNYEFPYTIDRTVSATLSSLDCNVPIGPAIYYYDFYRFTLPAQQSVALRMAVSALPLDPWLDLFTSAYSHIGLADDSSFNSANAYMEAILGAGDYVIGANSATQQQTGTYTLSSAIRPTAISGCRLIWATRAVTVTESVGSSDCVAEITPGSAIYFDRLWIALDSAARVTVRMESSVVNASLFLFDLLNDTLVAQNDDSSAGTTTAYINYTAPDYGLFELALATSTPNQTGQYTVAIVAPVSALVAVSPGGAPLFALPASLRRDLRVSDPSAARAGWRLARSSARDGS